MSETRFMASSGMRRSSSGGCGSFSQRRTASQPTKPTSPEVSGGTSSKRSVCSSAMVSRSASTGLPPVGAPAGACPIQCASPSRAVSVARESAPMKE